MSWLLSGGIAALILHILVSIVLWDAQSQSSGMIDIGLRDRLVALFWLPILIVVTLVAMAVHAWARFAIACGRAL